MSNDSTYDRRAFPIARPTPGDRGSDCPRFQREFLAGAQAYKIDDDWSLDEVLLGNDAGGDGPLAPPGVSS